MITLTTTQLEAWLGAFLLPLMRILAVFSVAPILGNAGVPGRVRIGLAVLITLMVAPGLPPLPQVNPGAGLGLAIIAEQIIIGLAIGFAMRLIFAAIDLAGALIDLQMGLGFAAYYDPQMPSSSTLTSQLFGILATLIFLALNGHLLLVSVMIESFNWLPIAAAPAGAGMLETLVAQGARVFAVAVLIALPMIAAMLITNLTFGVLTRAAPQLNVIAIGFPLTVSVGLIVLVLTLPTVGNLMSRLLIDWVGVLPGIFGAR
jgi:flagellar biosynthetic protein FliR